MALIFLIWIRTSRKCCNYTQETVIIMQLNGDTGCINEIWWQRVSFYQLWMICQKKILELQIGLLSLTKIPVWSVEVLPVIVRRTIDAAVIWSFVSQLTSFSSTALWLDNGSTVRRCACTLDVPHTVLHTASEIISLSFIKLCDITTIEVLTSHCSPWLPHSYSGSTQFQIIAHEITNTIANVILIFLLYAHCPYCGKCLCYNLAKPSPFFHCQQTSISKALNSHAITRKLRLISVDSNFPSDLGSQQKENK